MGAPAPPATVVVADVNRLKAVNDRHGHAEGDGMLRAVAALLVRHFGGLNGGLVARLGGDEFGVILPGHRADRVLAAARAACVEADRLPHGVGIACGVATLDDRALPAELIRAADAAQYSAKGYGRSRVVLAGQDGAAATAT